MIMMMIVIMRHLLNLLEFGGWIFEVTVVLFTCHVYISWPWDEFHRESAVTLFYSIDT